MNFFFFFITFLPIYFNIHKHFFVAGAKHKMYIVVKLHEITELWYFFSINTCFLFFTTTSACAQNIRAILEMYDKSDKAGYYDPDSESKYN